MVAPAASSPATMTSQAVAILNARRRRVGFGGDPLADLIVGALHLRVVAVDVLACEAEQLGVVGAFETLPARGVDGSHLVLLVGYAALMGFEGVSASRHSGQPSSRRRAER